MMADSHSYYQHSTYLYKFIKDKSYLLLLFSAPLQAGADEHGLQHLSQLWCSETAELQSQGRQASSQDCLVPRRSQNWWSRWVESYLSEIRIFIFFYNLYIFSIYILVGVQRKQLLHTKIFLLKIFFISEYSNQVTQGLREGTWDTINTLKFRATPQDDGSSIRCVAEHRALKHTHLEKKIDVTVYCK